MAREFSEAQAKPSGWRHKVALTVFLAVSLFYLVFEHTVHLFGLVSYFLVLICALMHFLHHGRRDIHRELQEHKP